jgi:glycerol-3-phosphate acyltransferase PlsY
VKAAPVRRALPRAAFHAAIGIVAAACLYLLSKSLVLVLLGLGTVVFFAIDLARLNLPGLRRRFAAWFAPFLRREEDSRLTGASYYLIGCLVSVLAFPRDIAILAILFLSLGDPAATLFGMWQGRVRLWGKSLEGNAACLVVCLVISLLVAGISGSPVLLAAVAGAVTAAFFQALPLPLNDNLTIPIGSGLVMLAVSALVT